MLQKYFYFQDLIKNKIGKANTYFVIENSFGDISLSRNGPGRDAGHLSHSGTVPGNPGHLVTLVVTFEERWNNLPRRSCKWI